MNLLDILVCTLAAGAVLDVWFNGSIFADWRAYFQAAADGVPDELDELPSESFDSSDSGIEDGGDPPPFIMRVADLVLPRFFAELLTCVFCLSYHVPWIILLLYLMPVFCGFESEAWTLAFKFPGYSLAITRLGNILNAYLPQEARYDR